MHIAVTNAGNIEGKNSRETEEEYSDCLNAIYSMNAMNNTNNKPD